MRRRRVGLVVSAAVCVNALASASAAVADPDAAMRAARAAAGKDLRYLYDVQCRPWRPVLDTRAAAPMKVTDTVYYVGGGAVGAWAVDTEDGVIVLDTMNNAREAESLIAGGLRRLGVDPARIRYVVVHHGHFDHMGGAAWLQQTYGAKVWMTAADWKMAGENPHNRARDMQMPALDHAIEDGDVLKLGSTTLTFHATPGHTPGTVSTIIPTSYKGQRHVLAIWGGSAFPKEPEALDDYVRSVRAFAERARAAAVDGVLSNHGELDDVVAKMASLRRDPAANPFVIGQDAASRFFSVLEGCALASKAWS